MTERDLVERITDYLTGGGLFNPELADHMAVRDLLLECRDALQAVRAAAPAEPTAAWMICEPGCEYGPTFGTENAALSALTKAPPGSELVELVRRKA